MAFLLLSAVLLALLSGCLYPEQRRSENRAAVAESVLVVQNAIEQYKQKTGVLPIKNSEPDTPIYEKYVIDMKRLTQGPYLGKVPAIAFENGGKYLFVLINPETKPEVRLLDIAAYQLAAEVQREADAFKSAKGKLPLGEPAGTNVYRLDFSQMGKPVRQVQSPFSQQFLGFLIDGNGTVGIDYAPEIAKAMQAKGIASAEPGVDLRTYLVESSPFVPVRSFAYKWVDQEPRPAAP
jgi:hypothetical protein